MIRLDGVSKSYRLGENEVRALDSISLEIAQGDFTAIQGPSGSGKSTLLNVLGILDGYDSGTYYLEGEPVRALSERAAARYRNRFIGFVFQSFNLISYKTAAENVALPLFYQGVARRERNAKAVDYLDRFGMKRWRDHLPTELSGGQAQRVAIARALVTEPSLILADEPTGALDTENSRQIMATLREINAEGVTVVVVTHDDEIAAELPRTIRIRDGRAQG